MNKFSNITEFWHNGNQAEGEAGPHRLVGCLAGADGQAGGQGGGVGGAWDGKDLQMPVV